MNKYRQLLQNIGLFALNTVATKLISFLLVPLYTSYLSPGMFGITDMATTVITLVTPLVTLSIGDGLVRFLIEDRENQKTYATFSFALTLTSCLAVALLLPLLDMQIFGGLGEYKLLFWATYSTNAFLVYMGDLARGLNEVKLIPISSIASSLVTCIGAVIFIAGMEMGVNGYFYSLILGSLVGMAIYFIAGCQYRLISPPSYFRGNKRLWRKMLLYSLPLIPNTLFWWIGSSINRFFITAMISISASGLYAAASKIPNILNLIYSIFQQAWNLSAFQEAKHEGISHFFSIIFKLLNAITVVASSGLILISPWLAKLLLQKDFFAVWPLIGLLVVAFYFNTLNAFYGSIFTSSMRTRHLFTTTGLGAGVSILFTWILIPRIGLSGACVAMIISNFSVLIMRIVVSRTIMTITIAWPYTICSILILIIQASMVVLHPDMVLPVSIICLAVIILIEFCNCLPLLRKVVSRLHTTKSI